MRSAASADMQVPWRAIFTRFNDEAGRRQSGSYHRTNCRHRLSSLRGLGQRAGNSRAVEVECSHSAYAFFGAAGIVRVGGGQLALPIALPEQTRCINFWAGSIVGLEKVGMTGVCSVELTAGEILFVAIRSLT